MEETPVAAEGGAPPPERGLAKSWVLSLGHEWRDCSIAFHVSTASPAETGSEAVATPRWRLPPMFRLDFGLRHWEPWLDLKGGHDVRT